MIHHLSFSLDELTDLKCVFNQNMFCAWSLIDLHLIYIRASLNQEDLESPKPATFVDLASYPELSDQQDFVRLDV